MAIIKSYTDLSQSKKLAEILPLESADMYYLAKPDDTNSNMVVSDICILRRSENDGQAFGEACAWSLAALLDVIKEQGFVDLRFLRSTFDNIGNHLTNVWCCTFEDIGTVTLDLYSDNPIDACYEHIIRLHDLYLL